MNVFRLSIAPRKGDVLLGVLDRLERMGDTVDPRIL